MSLPARSICFTLAGGSHDCTRHSRAQSYSCIQLASPQGAITGEKFERFETTFVGAGETLSAGLAALLATGVELHAAVGEALAFLDQALDAGFRPGMGNVIPDRFFWALPEEEEGEPGDAQSVEEVEAAAVPKNPRHVH